MTMETSSSGTKAASENEAGNIVALKPGAVTKPAGDKPDSGKPKSAKAVKTGGDGEASAEKAAFGAVDVEAFSRNLARAIEQGGKALAAYMKPREEGKVEDALAADIADIVKTVAKILEYWLADPERTLQLQQSIGRSYLDLWASAMHRLTGEEFKPVVAPDPKDKRFADPEWSQNQFYDFLKQLYLLTVQWSERLVKDAEGIDEHTRRKAEFYIRQFANALAPSNFVFTNPELMRETLISNAENLANGLEMLSEDIAAGRGNLRIRQTDPSNFAVGRNLALTPGKVIYQNELMQLIQYEATTDEVFKVPLLIVPPWINKFYILDLREKNSYIKWCVDQGHTVFVISWVNPDERHADKTFESYVQEGIIAALDAIEQQTGEKSVNAAGYCLGGTLLATTLAYLAGKRQASRISAATFFTTMTDFTDPGELGVFIDEGQVSSLEKKMFERGYLEGSEMAGTFNMLRANDLIWSFVVNNYLLGKDPFPFDLLYWNSDSTRMPAKMHSFYLRKLYMENRLVEPGGITIDGVAIDLGKIKTPCYFISTIEDHIAPWKSTYAGARNFGGPVRFVLGGSGHIAGIVNPPAANKYGFWINPAAKLPATPDAWLEGAQQNTGSWWTDWQSWLTAMDSEQVEARDPAKGKLKVLEDAPGSFVKIRIDASKTAA